MKVLYIDDDAVNRQVIHDMLVSADVEMMEAPDAESGLAMIDKSELDVVLVDLRMAGMNGLTAVSHVRARPDQKANLPLIIITADTSPNLRQECIAGGADEMLLKPVGMRDLFNVIGRAIRARADDDILDM